MKRPQSAPPRHSIVWFVIASTLVLFLIVYLSITAPDMVPPLRSFFSHPITIIAALLCLAIATRVFMPKAWKPDFGFIPDAIVVALTIGLFLEVPHIKAMYIPPQRSLDIAGEWDYQVTDASGAITHGGRAIIQQNEKGIQIDGHRLYHVPQGATRTVPIPNGGTYWYTEMVALYGDPVIKVHFIYTIRLPGTVRNSAQIVQGYVVLSPKGVPISTLEGTYTHLAPGQLTGDIVFTRKSRVTPGGHR